MFSYQKMINWTTLRLFTQQESSSNRSHVEKIILRNDSISLTRCSTLLQNGSIQTLCEKNSLKPSTKNFPSIVRTEIILTTQQITIDKTTSYPFLEWRSPEPLRTQATTSHDHTKASTEGFKHELYESRKTVGSVDSVTLSTADYLLGSKYKLQFQNRSTSGSDTNIHKHAHL